MLTQLFEVYLPSDFYLSLTGVQTDVMVFMELFKARLPRLAAHLEALELDVSYFSVQWFVSLFTYNLPKASVFRVWDVLFVRGTTFLFEVALGLLNALQSKLLATHDFSSCYIDNALKAVATFTRDLSDPEVLLEAAHVFMGTVSSTELSALRVAKRRIVHEEMRSNKKLRMLKDSETLGATSPICSAVQTSKSEMSEDCSERTDSTEDIQGLINSTVSPMKEDPIQSSC